MNHSPSHISSQPRLSWPRLLAPRKNYTAEEVRERLRGNAADVTDARTAAVQAMAARTAIWSSNVPDQMKFELGRAASRLPTVVFWYCQGASAGAIGRRLSPFGDAWDGNQALDAAAWLIASALNRGRLAGVAA